MALRGVRIGFQPNHIMSELVPEFLKEFGKPDVVEVCIVDRVKQTSIVWRCGNNYRYHVSADKAIEIASRFGITDKVILKLGSFIELVGKMRNYEYHQIEQAEFMKDNKTG